MKLFISTTMLLCFAFEAHAADFDMTTKLPSAETEVKPNVAIIRQTGGSNVVHIKQSGEENQAQINQEGERNTSDISQSGKVNGLELNQQGQENSYTRKQMGNSKAVINQNGDVQTIFEGAEN